MAKFIRGNELNTEVEKFLKQLKSRFIYFNVHQAHDRYASVLKTKN